MYLPRVSVFLRWIQFVPWSFCHRHLHFYKCLCRTECVVTADVNIWSRIICTMCPRITVLEGSWQNIEQARTDRWKGAVPKLVSWETAQQVLTRDIRKKGKVIPLQALVAFGVSRRHSAHEGGKVVTLTHRPSLPPGISWCAFLEAESTPGHKELPDAPEKIPSDRGTIPGPSD